MSPGPAASERAGCTGLRRNLKSARPHPAKPFDDTLQRHVSKIAPNRPHPLPPSVEATASTDFNRSSAKLADLAERSANDLCSFRSTPVM